MRTLIAVGLVLLCEGWITFAQGVEAPLPKVIILTSTNAGGSMTVIENTATGKPAPVHIAMTCMTAKSVDIKTENKTVILSIREVIAYMPRFIGSEQDKPRKLQTVSIGELSLNLHQFELVQINGDVFTAGELPQKFKGPIR